MKWIVIDITFDIFTILWNEAQTKIDLGLEQIRGNLAKFFRFCFR